MGIEFRGDEPETKSEFHYETQPGEVWEDGEGTLMVAFSTTGDDWWVFANVDAIHSDNPLIVHPLRKAIDVAGNVLIDKLRYPNGKATRD